MTSENPSNDVPPVFIPRSTTTTEINKTGSWRFLRPRYDEKTAPCSAACPTGEDIGRIEMLTAQGLFKEAWETVLKENPFPAVCGRVCYHPCEQHCNRGEFDDAVAIHAIERFLADTASRYGLIPSLPLFEPKPQRVAVVGAGPSGLAAAYFLGRLGYQCDVFESMPEPGGVLRWGIPPYRLPPAVLQQEVEQILAGGAQLHCGKRIDQEFIREAAGNYQAIFLGCGHSLGRSLNIPGENLEGVEEGLNFLERLRQGTPLHVSGPVAVIGGGNTAIDVARSTVRLGGKPIIIYRRRREDMPAFPEEIRMAEEEGVEIHQLLSPVSIEPEPNGGFRLILQQMRVEREDDQGRAVVVPEPGLTAELIVNHVVKAIGAGASDSWHNPPNDSNGLLRLDHCTLFHDPSRPVLVYGGDLVAPIKSVVHAVASGKAAAMALDTFFADGFEAVHEKLDSCRVGNGPAVSMEIYMGGERCKRNPHVVDYLEINTDYFQFAPKIAQPRLLREERVASFAEIDLKISANLAIREAERCFNCGLCNQCDNCRLFCPDVAVVCDESPQGRRINYDYCKGCGICTVECPRNAMVLEEENA